MIRRVKNAEALIVFAKRPEKGHVKTRVAHKVGEEKALSIYNELLSILRSTLREVDMDIYLYADQHPIFDEDRPPFHARLQEGRNLGMKMSNAFLDLLPHYKKVVIIGADCPYLDAKMIDEAFKQLDQTTLTIGPSKDGGYYLLGMKKMHQFLFEDIEWSTSKVLQTTLNKAIEEGLNVSLLDTLEDIDTFEAWERYKSHNNV